jgi:KaiC/GvpD/RAD55 family RecA-like ATPase
MYESVGTLPVDGLSPGTNLLVAGPPMTGKAGLATDLLEAGCEDGEQSVAVLTRDSARALRRRCDCLGSAIDSGRAGIVDCVSRQRGRAVRDTEWVSYVSSPSAITDVGIRLGHYFQAFHEAGGPTRVGLVSVSTLLMYTELRRVYRFLHVFTGKVSDLDWVSVAVMEMNDPEAVETLMPLFDGVVRTRESGGRREARVLGLGGGPSEWTTY